MMESWILISLLVIPGTVSAWSVTFETRTSCVLKGSSVEFRCSYNYTVGETVRKTVWSKGGFKNGTWKRTELSNLTSYEGRVQYLGDQLHDCSLAIHDLQDNDTGYYYFRFDTDTYGWRSRKSVYLSVTELSARVIPNTVRAGDNVILECGTSCQLPTTVWFKDGHPVAKPEFQAQAEDSGKYSCAVKGQESVQSDPVALDVQSPPLNVSVEVSHSGQVALGSSVNLTCSSASNPAADSYTWYKRTDSSSSQLLQVGTGQVLSLPSLEASQTGLYLCQVRNRLGKNNSTEVLLTLHSSNIHHLILPVGIGVLSVIVLLLPLVIVWAWRRKSKSAVDKEDDSPDYENISNILVGQKNKATQKEMPV
ncbi:B-cell receptor CD22-like isoform X2 [Thunnus albacares]|uniref:B-cell receptor CD22-like isoform X2 n=1 Tax=Thunnus albacares TaxID=8236 RepID=UPI001CF6B57A|nr:B-cell receptor CD22-like isoform X2 [Thunnus albacares]